MEDGAKNRKFSNADGSTNEDGEDAGLGKSINANFFHQ